jgi:hypothetical protein
MFGPRISIRAVAAAFLPLTPSNHPSVRASRADAAGRAINMNPERETPHAC